MKYNKVIVLAAGRCPADLRQHTGVTNVADLRLGDHTMVDRVVGAFREAGFDSRDQIITVGTRVEGCTHAPGGEHFIDSLRSGLEVVKKDTSSTIFVATCDMPFLTGDEVSAFIEAQRGSALYCAVARMESCIKRFPTLARTALTVAEGAFTLGNIFAGERWVWNLALPIAEKAYEARKSKVKLALMLGLTTAVRYQLARRNPSLLSIEQLESRASDLIRCPVHAVIGDWPGIGTDVDSLAHYEAAKAYFATEAATIS